MGTSAKKNLLIVTPFLKTWTKAGVESIVLAIPYYEYSISINLESK